MATQHQACPTCFSYLSKIRTTLSLYSKHGDIIIKNYPLLICGHCGQIDVSKGDIKKTLTFLEKQKNKNGKVS